MKVKRPFDQFLEIFRASNHESKEILKYVFEKTDSVSLWIIGLSIGGISIFANNIANIQQVISPSYLRAILLLLSFSVTCGIIYRGLYLYLFVLLDGSFRGINIAFSNEQMMDLESNLNGNETFSDLVETLKTGFGENLSYLIPVYQRINVQAKQELYESVVTHYKKRVEFAQMDTDNALDFVAETYSKFFGISKEKFLSDFESNSVAKKFKWTVRLTSLFYLVYILTFITALFTFVLAT